MVPGSLFVFFVSEKLFLGTFSFQNTSTECFWGLIKRWLLLKILIISLLEKCQPHKIVGGRGGGGGGDWPRLAWVPPFSLRPCAIIISNYSKIFVLCVILFHLTDMSTQLADGVVTNVDFWYSFGRDVGYVYTTLSQHCVPDFDFLTCC